MTTNLKIDTTEIKNVEILKTGKWNGIDLTDKHLTDMVNNFKDGALEPFLGLDHDDKFTDRVKKALSVVSLGFVSQLRQVGGSLMADFKQVPVKVAELIDSGMLKKRSVEFFRKFPLNGKVLDNVLKAVSFFGADVPAVNALSNDFDILLKSNENAILLSNVEKETTKIIFKEVVPMETIELKKTEYEDLLKDKNTVSRLQSDLDSQKAEVTKLTDANKEIVTTLKAKEEELKTKDAAIKKIEKEKTEDLKAEAEKFVSDLIKDGKLLSKFKDDKIEDYISKAKDPEKLKTFKEDLETRDKVIELGQLGAVGESGIVQKDISEMSNDEIQEAIEFKMKKENIKFEEAAEALGVDM